MSKYPKEVGDVVRQKTLSIVREFSLNEEKPLKVFDDTFSRFVITVIENGKSAFFNLKVKSLEKISLATKWCFEKHLESQEVPSAEDSTSSAFTVKFVTGKLKGKSPAQVLIEDPENGRAVLNEQFLFLKKGLDKYPNNQKIMDAIKAAASLTPEQLSAPVKASFSKVIYKTGVKPLVHRAKDEDGNTLCYEGEISWDSGMNYPVTITVTNFYAPVIKKDDGTLNVQISKKNTETEVDCSICLTDEEWLDIVQKMVMNRSGFEAMHYAEADKRSREMAAENRRDTMGETA